MCLCSSYRYVIREKPSSSSQLTLSFCFIFEWTREVCHIEELIWRLGSRNSSHTGESAKKWTSMYARGEKNTLQKVQVVGKYTWVSLAQTWVSLASWETILSFFKMLILHAELYILNSFLAVLKPWERARKRWKRKTSVGHKNNLKILEARAPVFHWSARKIRKQHLQRSDRGQAASLCLIAHLHPPK